MPQKRGLLLQANSAELEGRRGIDDSELHPPPYTKRTLKKARKTQPGPQDDDVAEDLGKEQQHGSAEEDGGDGMSSECCDGTDSSSGSGESGEEGGRDVISTSSDELGKQVVFNTVPREVATNSNEREKDRGPVHDTPNMPTSTVGYLALEHAKSWANNIGTSGSSSDEDTSENEETEEGPMPTTRGATKEEETSDESSGSSSDGESDEEEEESEKKPDDSTAFGRAFRKIMKKKLPSTALTEAMGPMLSAHKQLVTKKLEEAAEGRKTKSESKREKQALREKGHTVPGLYAAAKDKELMKLATRGVVKLFNAVSKAQTLQEAAKVSKDSDVKEVAKRSKSTFLAMLQGGNGAVSQSLNMQKQPSDSKKEVVAEGQPGWSALRETFMLGKSRLKDWDKQQDEAADIKGAESSGDDSDSE
eukprot:c24793_g1_i1 orf=269-1525(+)